MSNRRSDSVKDRGGPQRETGGAPSEQVVGSTPGRDAVAKGEEFRRAEPGRRHDGDLKTAGGRVLDGIPGDACHVGGSHIKARAALPRARRRHRRRTSGHNRRCKGQPRPDSRRAIARFAKRDRKSPGSPASASSGCRRTRWPPARTAPRPPDHTRAGECRDQRVIPISPAPAIGAFRACRMFLPSAPAPPALPACIRHLRAMRT